MSKFTVGDRVVLIKIHQDYMEVIKNIVISKGPIKSVNSSTYYESKDFIGPLYEYQIFNNSEALAKIIQFANNITYK